VGPQRGHVDRCLRFALCSFGFRGGDQRAATRPATRRRYTYEPTEMQQIIRSRPPSSRIQQWQGHVTLSTFHMQILGQWKYLWERLAQRLDVRLTTVRSQGPICQVEGKIDAPSWCQRPLSGLDLFCFAQCQRWTLPSFSHWVFSLHFLCVCATLQGIERVSCMMAARRVVAWPRGRRPSARLFYLCVVWIPPV